MQPKAVQPPTGFEELTDWIADVLEITTTIYDALGDGFQLTDILAFVGEEKKAREVINDAPTFWAQLLGATGPIRLQAIVAARDRVLTSKGPLNPITTWTLRTLYMAARANKGIEQILEIALTEKAQWDLFLKGGEVLPPPA